MKSSIHDKVEGAAKIIAGHVEEVTGKVIGSPRLQVEGGAKQAEGQIQKKIGEIKQVVGN